MEKAKTYVVWNVREGMTHPGIWYLDRTSGELFYYPNHGENNRNVKVIAPSEETIIRLEKGVKNITLDGLALSCTTTALVTGGFGAGNYSAAVQGESLENCRLRNITVENVGGWGLKLTGRSLWIEGCDFRNTGAGGIKCDGDSITIVNNRIREVGLYYPSAIAVWVNGNGHEILHNEITGTSYSGIVLGGNRCRIESNRIGDMMRVLTDGGAIYITFCKDVVVRGNMVRGGRSGVRAHAYYMDEQAENCSVEYNLAIDVGWPCHNHMTRKCFMRNNVFIDSGKQYLSFDRTSDMTFERNILVAEEITLSGPSGCIVAMPKNIIHSISGRIFFKETAFDYSEVKTEPLVPRDGTIFSDPKISGVAMGAIRFLDSSPAPALGIIPIDVHRAGKPGKKPR